MEAPPSAKDREISVRHGGDLSLVKLLAGNAFTLAYVTARINQKIPAFDSTFKLCYNDPSGTEEEAYTLNTDEDLKEAFVKFDAVSPRRRVKFVTMKKAASGPPTVQPSGGWSSLAKEETNLFASSPLREPLIEGVEVGHYLSLDRFPLCAHFRHLFTQYSAVIFRSPPHSGKTSIASLLADYLARSTAIKTYYVCATLANYDSAPPSAEEPALRAWNWQLRTFETVSGTLTEIMDVSNKTDRLLVLDEAQMWYRRETAQLPVVAANFWAKLKVVPMDGPLRVLVLSTYMSSSLSSATPFTFAPGAQVALPDTLLSSEEMSELFRRWSTAYDLRLTPLVQQYLRRLTGGHIGYLTGLLSGLRQKRGLYKQEDPETLYLNTLAYPGEVLNYCRIAPSSHLDAKYEKLLKALLFKWAGLPFEEVAEEAGLSTNELEAAKSTLCHMGYIVETKEHKLQLTARVLHFYLAPILISPTNKEPLTTPDELLGRILRLCDPKRVADSLSRSATGAPNEYTWQGEFYVALCQCLPKGVSASISFGHGYGTDGAVDFYINSKYKWAFELTREGDRLTEHVDRFVKANGLYYKLTQEARDKPCVIKEWRVVDIRRKKVYTKTMLDGVVYAIYDKTFTKFTLKRKDKDDESVAVESTMALRRAASLNRELNISSPAKAPP